MDSVIVAAARALASGDLLGALKRVSLREDAPALALRGIITAQLGDLGRARGLLSRAAEAFEPHEAVERARCAVALAEIALATRDLAWPASELAGARRRLEAHGDTLNAAHARHLEIRRLVLLGRLAEAEEALALADVRPLPPAWRAAHELVVASLALRRLRIGEARQAIGRARQAVRHVPSAGLASEVEAVARQLELPAARLAGRAGTRPLTLEAAEALFSSSTLVIDGCRHAVRCGGHAVGLATRPVLFALARALAEAWPEDTPRATLLLAAFGARHADDSHRARLRVEVGRLRRFLAPLCDVVATPRGFALAPPRGSDVAVLLPPSEGSHAAVLALVADGEAWSSSALAQALGTSQRSVQRALEALRREGRVEVHGRGRAQRWTASLPAGFTTALLLPGPMLVGAS